MLFFARLTKHFHDFTAIENMDGFLLELDYSFVRTLVYWFIGSLVRWLVRGCDKSLLTDRNDSSIALSVSLGENGVLSAVSFTLDIFCVRLGTRRWN